MRASVIVNGVVGVVAHRVASSWPQVPAYALLKRALRACQAAKMPALWQSERAVVPEKAPRMSLTLSTAHALMSWLKDSAL